jgi:uncharacterized damage-inducible protein DinB
MLVGEKRGAFPRKGSNWLSLPAAPTEKAWREDLALLDEAHRKLRRSVEALSPADLRRRPRGSKYPTATLVYGVASHDVYHTGQIQMLKRLWVTAGHPDNLAPCPASWTSPIRSSTG